MTHKIRSLTTDADGQPAFITYGTTTDTDDEMPVTYPYVLGKYEKCLSGVGNFFQFLKTTPRLHSVHLPAILFADPHGGHQLRPAVQAL